MNEFDFYQRCKPCGWISMTPTSFGDRFFFRECCPKCGAGKYESEMKVGRWNWIAEAFPWGLLGFGKSQFEERVES